MLMISSEKKINYFQNAMEGCAEKRNAFQNKTEELIALAKKVQYPKVDFIVNQVSESVAKITDVLSSYQKGLKAEAESYATSNAVPEAVQTAMKKIVDNADIKSVEFDTLKSDGLHEDYDGKRDGSVMQDIITEINATRLNTVQMLADLYVSFKAEDTESYLKEQSRNVEEVSNDFCKMLNNVTEVAQELNLSLATLQANLHTSSSSVAKDVTIPPAKGLDEGLDY